MGGVCGGLHGARIPTYDLDVVHSRRPENLSRLTAALAELQAVYRLQHNRQLSPPLSALAAPGHNLLTTICGDFDILGTIGESLSYEDLLPRTEMMDLGEGLLVRVLDLPTLIEVKKQAGRPRDLDHVRNLKEVLRERERLGSS